MSKRFFSNDFIVSGLIIILLIGAHYLSLISPLEKIIYWLFNPLQISASYLGGNVSQLLDEKTSPHDWPQENEVLQQKIENLEDQIVNLKNFIEENQLIAEQKKYLAEKKLSFITARIIGWAEDNNPNLLILNKGESDGLVVGMAVTGSNSAVVGKIVKTESGIAHLLLLIDNECRLDASLAGQTAIVGLAQGNHNTAISLEYILKQSNLQSGDLVNTSGADKLIPAGLTIGEIGQIDEMPNSLFKRAEIISPINFKNIKIVNVIFNQKAD